MCFFWWWWGGGGGDEEPSAYFSSDGGRYRGAEKSLARPGRKEINVSVGMA